MAPLNRDLNSASARIDVRIPRGLGRCPCQLDNPAASNQRLILKLGTLTRQWGFIASSAIYGTVYVRNWRRWRRREAMEADVERTDTAAAATGGAVPATGHATGVGA
jgi:hypothetical protein